MKYVLDASVAICWVIPRPLTPKAVRLRDEYQRQIHELLAPAVFIDEVAGALTKAERQKIVRLLVKQIDVSEDTITIHHSIPMQQDTTASETASSQLYKRRLTADSCGSFGCGRQREHTVERGLC